MNNTKITGHKHVALTEGKRKELLISFNAFVNNQAMVSKLSVKNVKMALCITLTDLGIHLDIYEMLLSGKHLSAPNDSRDALEALRASLDGDILSEGSHPGPKVMYSMFDLMCQRVAMVYLDHYCSLLIQEIEYQQIKQVTPEQKKAALATLTLDELVGRLHELGVRVTPSLESIKPAPEKKKAAFNQEAFLTQLRLDYETTPLSEIGKRLLGVYSKFKTDYHYNKFLWAAAEKLPLPKGGAEDFVRGLWESRPVSNQK